MLIKIHEATWRHEATMFLNRNTELPGPGDGFLHVDKPLLKPRPINVQYQEQKFSEISFKIKNKQVNLITKLTAR